MPLQGMEVPLMVLQSKVFLICLLQKFTPVISKKRTFIRRVRTQIKDKAHDIAQSIRYNAVVESIHALRSPSSKSLKPSSSKHFRQSSLNTPAPSDIEAPSLSNPQDGGNSPCAQPDFMAHFTKTPFPEPRRVIKIRPRVIEFQSETLSI